jgi:PKD repeat protein
MRWADALSFCENLDYAGHTDWKLPDAKELQSIWINPATETDPAIDTTYFNLDAVELADRCNDTTFTSYPFFWSSTTHKEYDVPNDIIGSGDKAVYIAFGKAWGYIASSRNGTDYAWRDVHAPGSQRSDPKNEEPATYNPCGHGPQKDYISHYNYVRCVRSADGSEGGEVIAPVTDFTVSETLIYIGETVFFSDESTGNPTSWEWTFEGGTPSTSTDQNPVVAYNTVGTYRVVLTINNEYGSDTTIRRDFITVENSFGNLIENPGLETGVEDPWVGSGNFQVQSSEVYAGTYAMDILRPGSRYDQVVDGLYPDTTYTLSAYGKGKGMQLVASGFGGDDVTANYTDKDN